MPYSDLGVLLPTEAQYGSPQAYTEAIRAESNKQATYLSNMDQFYAQLDESKRQFDLNYSAREKEFAWTSGFEEKKLAYQEEIDSKQLALATRKADLEAQLAEKDIEFKTAQLGFQKESLGLEKEKLQAELEKLRTETGIAQQQMSLQQTLGLGELNIKQQELGLKAQETKFGEQLQYAQFQAGLTQAFPNGIMNDTSNLAPGQFPSYTSATAKYGSLVTNPSTNSYGTYVPGYGTTSASSKYAYAFS